MSELSSLPNIGKAVDEQLCSVGIKKTLIPEERKKELKEFYMAHRIVK